MSTKGKKVYVAMSGGVDSSVSAALLKEQGYDVTGVFMNVWQSDFLECTQKEDRRDAMRVAAHLGIPFLVFDFEKEYKEEVVDYMIGEYRVGRTPNPDVMCNKHLKFGIFLKKSLAMGADYIATGHYARTNDQQQLLAGSDKNKDQTYFLWTLTKEQLAYVIFPIGDLKKPKVRELARKFGLPTAERKESQGVCFIGEFHMREFLSHYISKKKGDVLNDEGEVIGHHEGAFFYTFGQRHGFTVTKKIPKDTPYYIISKDVDANTITVSHKKEELEHAIGDVSIVETSFVAGEEPKLDTHYMARIRYRQRLEECRLEKGGVGEMRVIFKKPQIAVAPGQSLVIYNMDVCIGGGILK